MRRIGHKTGVLLAIAGLTLTLWSVGAGTQRTSVPWVLGHSQAQAVKRIEGRALHAEVLDRSSGAHKLSHRYRVKDQVVFQNYRGGIVLPVGSTVRVMIYKPRRG